MIAIILPASLTTSSAIFNPAVLAVALPSDIATLLPIATGNVYWEGVYLVASLIVGGLIAYQALVLKRMQGKLPTTVAFNLASICETVWLMVSSIILYFVNLSLLPKVIAVAYLLYGIMGWIYSFYLLKDEDVDLIDIEDMIMPNKYMDYSLSFSLIISLSCLTFLWFLYTQGKFFLL